jgi:Tol biopolymer transport system component
MDLTTGVERRLLSGLFQVPGDVSANGSQIIYNQRSELGNWDLMLVSVDDTSRVSPLFASPFSEIDGRLASGGARMSLTSDESGRAQVYVSSFPVTGTKTAVSTTGGHTARWRRDGRELYFRSRAGQLMAAPIDSSGVPGTPRTLFDAKAWLDYDVAKDGRFIAVVSQKVAGEQPLAVIVNWSPPGGPR